MMSTERQIESNRKNAQRSTGPRSAEGKARVASNALKHGLTARRVVMPDENFEEFDTFRLGVLGDLNPNGENEQDLADKIVRQLWRLRRVPALEAALYGRANQSAMEPGELDSSTVLTQPLGRSLESFARLSRHETALSRSLLNTLREFQRLHQTQARFESRGRQ